MLLCRMTARRFLAVVVMCGTLSAVSVGVPSLPVNSSGNRYLALLPGSNQVAQVMRKGTRLTILDMQQRVLSVGGSREALQNAMASVAKGQIPAYDARLGISQAEFDRYIANYIAFQPTFESTGKTMRLSVVRDASRVTFTDTASNGLLRGLSFDLRTGDLRVPEGFAFKAAVIAPSTAPDRSIDLRGGLQWNLRGYNADTQSGINGQVSLFQLGDTQVLLIYKRVSSLIHGTFNNNASEIILKYTR